MSMTAAAAKTGISDGFTTPLVLISFLEAVLDVNVRVVKLKSTYFMQLFDFFVTKILELLFAGNKKIEGST